MIWTFLLLQETRSDGSVNELRKWQKVFNSKQIYLSSYGTRAVGAGIIIRSNESFKVIQHHEDPRGRYVWVVGDHEESRFLFLSFYSPSISNEIRRVGDGVRGGEKEKKKAEIMNGIYLLFQ